RRRDRGPRVPAGAPAGTAGRRRAAALAAGQGRPADDHPPGLTRRARGESLMLVAVTGGTGYVGSHSVRALLLGGHQVRLLVRAEAAVERALRPLGVDPAGVDVVVGDVTDPAAVRRAVRGADGVLHAASVFSFDSRDHARMRTVNERGTDAVLDAARAAGAGRIVHVSSIVALMPSRRRPLTADSPVGRSRETYFASKAAAEVGARRHQEGGAPVAISD